MRTIGLVLWPTGGTPPIAKPVASRTKSASARAIGSPIAAAAFFSSTRSTPEAMINTACPLAAAAEDQRLRDLRDLAADRRRSVGGGARARVELENLEPVAERGLNLERGGAFGWLHRADPSCGCVRLSVISFIAREPEVGGSRRF